MKNHLTKNGGANIQRPPGVGPDVDVQNGDTILEFAGIEVNLDRLMTSELQVQVDEANAVLERLERNDLSQQAVKTRMGPMKLKMDALKVASRQQTNKLFAQKFVRECATEGQQQAMHAKAAARRQNAKQG